MGRCLTGQDRIGCDVLPTPILGAAILDQQGIEPQGVIGRRVPADDLAIGTFPETGGQPGASGIDKDSDIRAFATSGPTLPVDRPEPKPILAVDLGGVGEGASLRCRFSGGRPGHAEILGDVEDHSLRGGIGVGIGALGEPERNREGAVVGSHERWQAGRGRKRGGPGVHQAQAWRQAGQRGDHQGEQPGRQASSQTGCSICREQIVPIVCERHTHIWHIGIERPGKTVIFRTTGIFGLIGSFHGSCRGALGRWWRGGCRVRRGRPTPVMPADCVCREPRNRSGVLKPGVMRHRKACTKPVKLGNSGRFSAGPGAGPPAILQGIRAPAIHALEEMRPDRAGSLLAAVGREPCPPGCCLGRWNFPHSRHSQAFRPRLWLHNRGRSWRLGKNACRLQKSPGRGCP